MCGFMTGFKGWAGSEGSISLGREVRLCQRSLDGLDVDLDDITWERLSWNVPWTWGLNCKLSAQQGCLPQVEQN